MLISRYATIEKGLKEDAYAGRAARLEGRSQIAALLPSLSCRCRAFLRVLVPCVCFQSRTLGSLFVWLCGPVLQDPDYRYYTNPAQSYCPPQQSAETFWSFATAAAPAHQNRSVHPIAPAPAATSTPISTMQRTGVTTWETWQGTMQPQQPQLLQQQGQQLLQREPQVPLRQISRDQQYDEDIAAVNEDMMRVFSARQS